MESLIKNKEGKEKTNRHTKNRVHAYNFVNCKQFLSLVYIKFLPHWAFKIQYLLNNEMLYC